MTTILKLVLVSKHFIKKNTKCFVLTLWATFSLFKFKQNIWKKNDSLFQVNLNPTLH